MIQWYYCDCQVLRDFNPSNEIFGYLCVFWHNLAKGSDFHKDPTTLNLQRECVTTHTK